MTIFEFKAHIRRVITTKVGGKHKLVVDISDSARKAIQKAITNEDTPTPFSMNDGGIVTWISVKDIGEYKELVLDTDLNLNVVMQARLQNWEMAGKRGWGLYLVGYVVSSAPSNTVVRLDGLEAPPATYASSSSSSSSSSTPKRKPAAVREPPKAPKKARQPSVSTSKATPLSSRRLDMSSSSQADLDDYTDGDEEWARAEMPDGDEASSSSFTQNIDLPSP